MSNGLKKTNLLPIKMQRVRPSDKRTGLVLELCLNDENLSDKSGNGNHPTLHGSPLFVEGYGDSNALDFTQVSENLTYDTLSVPFSEMTVVALVKFDALDNNARIVDWQSSGPVNGFSLVVTTGQPSFTIANGAGNVAAISASGVETGKWYLLIGTYGVNLAKFFVNGVLQGTDTSCTMTDASPQKLTIAKRSTGATNPFNGKVQTVRLYNRRLTQEEVLTLTDIIFEKLGL